MTSDSLQDCDEYEEDVATLTKLMSGKTPPAAQVVRQLLDSTRRKRMQWLKEEISLHDIFEKFPCLKMSKWVCVQGLAISRAYRPAKRGEGMQLCICQTAKCWWILKIEPPSQKWAKTSPKNSRAPTA